MRLLAVVVAITLLQCRSWAQEFLSAEDSLQLVSLLFQQEDSWNLGDIDEFMNTYWPTNQVVFVGADGPTYGWEAVRQNYHRRYPDREAMGTLQFTIVDLFGIDKYTAQMVGKYHLTRMEDNLTGVFTLIWRKFDDQWLIVSDHTSAYDVVSSLKTELDQLMQSQIQAHEPGGAMLVAQGNRILYQNGFGVADLQSREKITAHTVFNTGSVSKTFVANAILLLSEKGLLNLEDPITKYFDFIHPEIAKEITIKHLLSHTSGLPDLRKVSEQEEFYLTANDQENFAPILAASALNFVPGSRFQYSNPAYNGLALIVEKVTHGKWQDFLREHIFLPAKMTTSKITDGAEPHEHVAHAYSPQGNDWVENDYGEFPTFCAAGNGGIWSSVVELFYYEQALRNGTFLSQNAITTSREPLTFSNWQGSDSPFVGYGWWSGEEALFGKQIDGDPIYFHTGSQGGFRAYHIYYPKSRIFVAALFNRPVDRDLIEKAIKIVRSIVP